MKKLFAMAGILLATSALAPGQAQAAPHRIIWQGSVDDSVAVYVRGWSVWNQDLRGRKVEREYAVVRSPLPYRPTYVYLLRHYGRGRVEVVSQPRYRNGYTATVRIYDPQHGRSDYQFVLGWR